VAIYKRFAGTVPEAFEKPLVARFVAFAFILLPAFVVSG
jgi:hypothetical protein